MLADLITQENYFGRTENQTGGHYNQYMAPSEWDIDADYTFI